MLSQRYLWGVLGSGLFSSLSWANPPETVLATIQIQASADAPIATDSEQNSVAATKFAHEVLDVPFNRVYVPEQRLQQQDVQRVGDALNLVSGLFHQNSYGGGFWDNYSFRGFSTDPNLGAANIRNGLSVSRGIRVPKDMANVAALDFLKGPMAALYGRGEAGGLLNINTKKPQWTNAGALELRADSQQKYRLSLDYTAPLNDQLAYRIAAAHEDNQSFRDEVHSERWFVSPQLSWKLSDQTQMDFDSEFTRHSGTFDRGVSTIKQQFRMNPETFTGEPADGDTRVEDYFYQWRLNHQLADNWHLTSALSYKDSQMTGFSTEPRAIASDERSLQRQRRYRDYRSEDALAQAELRGELDVAGLRHEILAATEVGQLDYHQRQLRLNHSSSNPNMIDIYQPQYGRYLPVLNPFTDTTEQQRYLALNLQDQVFLNEQWSVLLGSRFDQIQQQFDNRRLDRSSSQDVRQFSPRAAINFRPFEQWSWYVNVGRSFALNSGLDRLSQPFAPERGQSYELGSKYQLTPDSQISVALFDLTKRNVLTTDPRDSSFQVTAGEVSSRGLELDAQAQVNPQLWLNANYSYTDAQIEQDQDLAKGARLSNVPRHTANLSLNYEFLQQGVRKAGIGSNISHVSARSGHSLDNGFDLPAYTLMDLNGYYQPNERLRYQLNLRNLLDKTYYISSYSELWVQPGDPLTLSLSARWRF